ncbi:hypothetical protein G6F50_016869 [Rhizopus delemar]|uniref:Uncharacterized protein n=1 Tax=Rhizopus delemar TaxID=936053 RepID=A0A9P6XS09_9FUNG|nr:hypothetical protein G6F50_016869 [Rhizopus delemar]
MAVLVWAAAWRGRSRRLSTSSQASAEGSMMSLLVPVPSYSTPSWRTLSCPASAARRWPPTAAPATATTAAADPAPVTDAAWPC